MGYSLLQISETLLKADRTMYKLGAIAYENMFSEDSEDVDFERDIIYVYKKAVEYADDLYLGTTKLDQVVERLANKLVIYDYGQLNPIYSDATITTQVVLFGAALDDLSDVTITNVQNNQTLRYSSSLGQWVNVGPGAATRNRQQFTATLNQTVFVTSFQFESGLLDVYLNGVKLSPPSYTTLGNYTITLSDGSLADDIIEVVAYTPETSFIDLSAYVLATRTLTINGVTYDLSANRSWTVTAGLSSVGLSMPSAFTVSNSPLTSNGTISVIGAGTTAQYIRGDGTLATFPTITSGTVTSVNMTVPTGLIISGNPITSSGTLAVALASGYSIPTTASQATWNTAYNDSIVSAAVTGTTTKTLTLNQQDGGTVTAIWSDLNTDAVTSVFGRTGAVVATEGDYTLTQLGDVTLTSPTNGQVLKYNGTTWVNNTDTDTGLTSVGLTMPSAFSVSNSPLTSNGTIAVTGAGSASQYVRGDGTLAAFPSVGGGGGGTVYYLNGNISQGSIGGTTMYQLSVNAQSGTSANFTRSTTGVIASFITDVNQPNQLTVPSGIWVFETYLSESGGGAAHATVQAVVEKWNGTSITVIATGTAEEITNGNVKDLYQLGVSIPTGITLSATDRIVVQIQIANTAGKTVTLYTENGNITSVSTTFANGLSSLNGLTATAQYFATGTSGTDFGISSSGNTHTFNLPTASASNRGLLSSANWNTFNNKQNAITLTTTGSSGASTFISDTLNVPTYTLAGLGGQPQLNGTGFVKISGTTISYDNSTYYLASNPNAYIALTALTASAPLSYNNISGAFTIAQASGTVNGYLSSTDWTTFNNKQNALTNPVTGTGTTNYIPKWTSGSALGNSIITDSGSIVTVGGVLTVSTANINLSNNYKLTGRNAANTLSLPLIGRNGSDRIDIDVDGYGTTIGGGGTIVLNPTGGNVGIGTSSPAYKLDINRSSLGAIAQFITLDGTYNPRLLINGTAEGIQLFATYSSGGAEALMFGTANSEKMRLTSNLLIGGIVDTGEKLQVNGAGRFSGGLIKSISDSSSAYIDIDAPASSSIQCAIRLYSSSGIKWHLSLSTPSTYRFSIGKSTSLTAFTEYFGLDHSTGAATFSSSVTASSFIKSGGTATQYLMADGSTSTLTNPVTGTGTTNYLPKWTSGSAVGNSLVYDSGTAIGIGTSSPDALLRVAGVTKIGEGVSSNTSKLMVNTINGVAAGIQLFQDGAESWIIQNIASSTALTFGNSGTERIRITSGGNLLVGTTTDSGERLQVNGTGRFSGTLTVVGNAIIGPEMYRPTTDSYLRINGGGSGIDGATILMFGSTHPTAAGRLNLNSVGSESIIFSAGGATRLTIASTGAATFSSDVTASSFIKSGGTSSQYLMADGSVTTGGGGGSVDELQVALLSQVYG